MDIVDYGNNGAGSRLLVVTELGHIKQLVTQLEAHLAESPDLCKRLASQIFSLTERSIGIITSSSGFHGAGRKKRCAPATPSSPIGDVVVDAPLIKKRRMINKKRTHQVRVSSCGGETRTAVDDGHSWRKYGQKEILGAKHPRGYYRCTHRHSQGCAATKQVQRTDEDPTLFDVIYVGTHTCVNRTAAAAGGQATQPPERNPDAHVDLLCQNLSGNLTVNTEGPAAVAAEPLERSAGTTTFCFHSSPASGGLALERSPFSVPSTTSEDWGVSPATSDSNHAVSFPPFGGAARDAEWWAQSDQLQEVVSALVAAGTAPPPALDIDDDDFLDIDISSFFV